MPEGLQISRSLLDRILGRPASAPSALVEAAVSTPFPDVPAAPSSGLAEVAPSGLSPLPAAVTATGEVDSKPSPGLLKKIEESYATGEAENPTLPLLPDTSVVSLNPNAGADDIKAILGNAPDSETPQTPILAKLPSFETSAPMTLEGRKLQTLPPAPTEAPASSEPAAPVIAVAPEQESKQKHPAVAEAMEKLKQMKDAGGEYPLGVSLDDLEKWNTVMEHRTLFADAQKIGGEIKTQTSRGVLPEEGALNDYGESRKVVLDRISEMKQKNSDLITRLPQRLLELTGIAQEQAKPAFSDEKMQQMWDIYNNAAQKMYAELSGGASAAQAEGLPMPGQEIASTLEVSGVPQEVPATPIPDATSAVQVEPVVPESVVELPPLPVASPEATVTVEDNMTPEKRFEQRKKALEDSIEGIRDSFKDKSGTDDERANRVANAMMTALKAGVELSKESDDAAKTVISLFRPFSKEAVGPFFNLAQEKLKGAGLVDESKGLPSTLQEEDRKKLKTAGILGLIVLLIEMGMQMTDVSVRAIVNEVASTTGASGR